MNKPRPEDATVTHGATFSGTQIDQKLAPILITELIREFYDGLRNRGLDYREYNDLTIRGKMLRTPWVDAGEKKNWQVVIEAKHDSISPIGDTNGEQ